MGQSPQQLVRIRLFDVQVARVPAESVSMVTQPQVPLGTARLQVADLRLNTSAVGNPAGANGANPNRGRKGCQ